MNVTPAKPVTLHTMPAEVVEVLRRYALRLRDREEARAKWGEIVASAMRVRASITAQEIAEKHHDIFAALRNADQHLAIEEGNLEKVALTWANSGAIGERTDA